MRPTEDADGVTASFTEGVETTGAAPAALLLDNKAPNKSAALLAALPAGTFLMHGTLGRGQSKATLEGSFGLFAQDLGPVTAMVDVASPASFALSVADAVTRAYATGRNRRPGRKDGKSPVEHYLTADPSPEKWLPPSSRSARSRTASTAASLGAKGEVTPGDPRGPPRAIGYRLVPRRAGCPERPGEEGALRPGRI